MTLAASVAMLQANILLSLGGKDSGSFAVMDLMRLPLGILTGVGFLDGGAILKKGGSIVRGRGAIADHSRTASGRPPQAFGG